MNPITFNFTGAIQNYTVPVSGTYDLSGFGAGGGAGTGFGTPSTGGSGAQVGATFNFVQGQQLQIIVGGAGSTGQEGAGGGGFTAFLANSGAGTPYSTLLIAGGGGGGGANFANQADSNGQNALANPLGNSLGSGGAAGVSQIGGAGGGGAGATSNGISGAGGSWGWRRFNGSELCRRYRCFEWPWWVRRWWGRRLHNWRRRRRRWQYRRRRWHLIR